MAKLSKRLLGAFVAICMFAALFTCLMGISVSASGTTPDLVEYKGADWTCMKYTKGWSTIAAGNYRFEMDCKIVSGVPCIQVGSDELGKALDGQTDYTATYDSENYKYIITFTMTADWKGNLGVLVGNYGTGGDPRDKSVTGDAVFACANPTLYLLDGEGNPTGESLINTFASDYYSTSRTGNKWNRRNFSSSNATCTSPIPDGYFDLTASEYMMRFYEGGKNVFAEYEDNGINLEPGDYSIKCKFKQMSGEPEFSLLYSADGEDYTAADLSVSDDGSGNRTALFTLSEAAKGIKIKIGNPTDAANVSIAVADIKLTKSGEEESLIEPVSTATAVSAGLLDANRNKKWNIHTDANNAAAVDLVDIISVKDGYFITDNSPKKVYENFSGKSWTRLFYKGPALQVSAGKKYIVSADFKVTAGEMKSEDIGERSVNFPALIVDFGGTVLKVSNADSFSGIVPVYDEAKGKVYIRFSPKTNMSGVQINVGSYQENSTGACAFGNFRLCEYIDKPDGTVIYKDDLIPDVTETSLYEPEGGKSANALENRWNTLFLTKNKNNEFAVHDYSAGIFKPTEGMIKINGNAAGAYVSYVDDGAVLSAGNEYRLQYSLKPLSGEPEFSFGAKQTGDSEGDDYAEIEESSEFIEGFVEEYDKDTFLRTVTFTPNKDISKLRILVGNVTPENASSLVFANASLCLLDGRGEPLGENILTPISRPAGVRNSSEQQKWNLVSSSDEQITVTAPVKNGVFAVDKMLKFESNNTYNRAVYFDTNLKFKPGTAYRFTADFMEISGTPKFTFMYRTAESGEHYASFDTVSDSYSYIEDVDACRRVIEFTTKATLPEMKELRIMAGNTGEDKNISAVFANPQLYIIVDGKPSGDNLLAPITDETVQYMGDMNYTGVWNLRYTGSKGSAIKVLDIPENYFRSPVLKVSGASGNIATTVTVKPDTYYKLSYLVKNSGSSDIRPYIAVTNANGSVSEISCENEIKNSNGYYNYSCEFKTSSGIKDKDNLRVGVRFDSSVSAVITNVQLFECSKGFEPFGVSLVPDGGFELQKEIPAYTSAESGVWTYTGSLGGAGIDYRSLKLFKLAVPQMMVFAGPNDGTYIGQSLSLVPGKTYDLSFMLKYANPGYEGDTGVDLLYNNSIDWVTLDAADNSPTGVYKKVYRFTFPASAADGVNNFEFRIRAGSEFVSGYIAGGMLTDTADKETNLLQNGDFADGIIGWSAKGGFRVLQFTEIPDGYFTNPQSNTPSMIVYRNAGSWENFAQSFLSLKPDTYYLLKAKSVHPWQPIDTSVYGIQMFGKDEKGDDISPFLNRGTLKKCTKCNEFVSFTLKTEKNDANGDVTAYTCNVCGTVYGENQYETLTAKSVPANSYEIIYHSLSDTRDNGNTYFRIIMPGGGNAGYWGETALYECTAKGEIISDNILINSDFSLGMTGWNISPTEKFDYRIVEQPKNFFETYKKNSGKMVVSNGTAKNATIGQSIDAERGKTYYFSGFYVNMNAAGITPKVVYTTVEGNTAVAPVEFFYDPDRFFFEGAFTLPDDADSVRGKATVQFLLDNGDKGKAYISDIGVYEEGKYENLFNNADFSNSFSRWQSNPNYTLSNYDGSVFVFYYDDSAFNDGDWSGTAATPDIKGDISGHILDGDGHGFANITVVLLPGRITARTDADGYFRFKNLKPGEYSLYVRTPKGEELFVIPVTVSSGMTAGVPDITLSLAEDGEFDGIGYDTDSVDYGIVCGYLFDAGGNPLKGQKLYLGDVGAVTTKKKGVFQFNSVPPGEYSIYTKLDDGSVHIFKTVTVVAGKGRIYKIKMPGKAGGFFVNPGWVWIIVIIAAGGALLLGGGALTVILVLIKRRKKFN